MAPRGRYTPTRRCQRAVLGATGLMGFFRGKFIIILDRDSSRGSVGFDHFQGQQDFAGVFTGTS